MRVIVRSLCVMCRLHACNRCWFNFCHSSTRFYVEETFGRWKNKWRFLMNPVRAKHKLATNMIYASAILHNFCLAHHPNHTEADATYFHTSANTAWDSFLVSHQAHMCPTCKGRGLRHCVHQASYRNGNAQTANARRAPSVVRDELCAELWRRVCGPDPSGASAPNLSEADVEIAQACGENEASCVREVMSARARAPRDVMYTHHRLS
jgi:hypothetical protein